MLHPSLEPALLALPSNKPVVLFTRHSLRELAPNNGLPSYDLPLTPQGVLLAEQWGGRLNRPIKAFYSSPVGRCVDTAKAMSRGAGIELAIEQSTVLVEPGCFVQNIRKVGPLFLQMGPLAFANHHFKEAMDGILSPKAGAAKLIQHFYQSQQVHAQGDLIVHVSHDTILAAFIYHLLQQQHITEDDWPWMMEGAWLWFDNSTLYWLWRGTQGQVDLADYLI
ncbi:MAG TPA: histidine phosphatase family protein [Agitococcus sp.]|nr:histidine phosphatase family protein [Moraxellaceae bacterium]MBL0231078.1 histidine phosphatase family protein [Moraxellaceae bacterium]HQV81239.1 histidine phosphatase family protein [Agitococcus sp.]